MKTKIGVSGISITFLASILLLTPLHMVSVTMPESNNVLSSGWPYVTHEAGGISRRTAPPGTNLWEWIDPSPLVTGVTSICAIGVPGPLWTLNELPIPVAAGDEDTTPVPSVVIMASSLGNGRVVGLGHDGFFTNEALELFDNKRLGNNIVDWLDKSGRKRILVTTGHREWYGGDNFNSFKSELEKRGYKIVRFSGALSQSTLSDIGVVLIGNAWGEFFQSEITALRDFVSNGGGLFLIGLGWAWEPYNPGKTLDDYPMNRIGEIFGIRWINGYISDPTNNYNGQPIFHIFYPNIELQTIYQAISYIQTTTNAHPNDLPSLLQSDTSIRSKYVKANFFMATATNILSQDSAQRREIYDFYKNLINNHQNYFRRNIVYDKSTQSVMAWLRERIYRSLIDALPLTSERKGEIASTIDLTGRYLDIWNDFTVLLLDNAGLNQRQKDFIYIYLSLIPKELHNLRVISVVDNLGVLPLGTPEIQLGGKDGGVNIFGFDIGMIQGNEFPDDVPPKYSDVFCLVVAHELNHIVDVYYVSGDQYLRSRREELIRRAGDNHMNYLRSMLPDGFFTSYPQEFFASIANQWFSDSALTLKLALARFDKGYKEPLNQFLFFANVYSRKRSSTLFYNLDTQGNILRKEVPLIKDQNDHIIAIINDGIIYRFTVDESGNVISYSTYEAPTIKDFASLFTMNYVRVIYPSDSSQKPLGCVPAMVSDWTASAFVTSKLGQYTEGLDINSEFVDQTSGRPEGSSGLGIVSFGGPIVNLVVKYAESDGTPLENRAPIRFHDEGEFFYFQFQNGTGIPGANLPVSVINHDKDMFVIEVYMDGSGRYLLLCYGLGWKGTYAAGKYFHKTIYPNLASYNVSWIIVKWVDTNGDGFVNNPDDGDTYTIIAQG